MKLIKLILLLFLILLFGCAPKPKISIDCGGVTFIKLYDKKSDDLKENFNLLIKENTNVLENCQASSYTQTTIKEMESLLNKYSLKSYNVSFICYINGYNGHRSLNQIIDFDTLIFEKDNKFYRYVQSFVPCDRKEIFFDSNTPQANYSLSLEVKTIHDYLNKNRDFCIKVGICGDIIK